MKRIISILLFSIPFFTIAQSGETLLLSGRVVGESHEGLPSASVSIKGTTQGTTTDTTGKFSLKFNHKFPFIIVITSVGFAPQELEVKSINSKLAIQLSSQSFYANQVVVSASRVAESILKSPVAIDKLNISGIQQSASPSFYDALENIKGLQMTTSSITFKVPNTRGFNIPNNFRFMQLVDGVDMQAATLGVPLGNAIGPTELDIESVEVTPGAASALYGMNAINGMANLLTKSPYKYQGLSLYQRTGLNHVDGIDAKASVLSESALRYAKAFNDKFAFKVNFSYMQATDWRSNTRLDQNTNDLKSANPGFPALNGAANPAFDGWNKYGDDALAGSNTSSISGLTIDGKTAQTLRVARTGYWETDLVDPKVQNLKFDGSLHYKFNKNTELSYEYRYGKMDGVFQRGNKIRLDGVVVQNHKVELKGKTFLIRAYTSNENTGNSFNVKPLADNLDLRSGGSQSVWAAKYKNALNQYTVENGALTSANLAAANAYARAKADAGRAEPGTAYFNKLRDTIRHINNWDIASSVPGAPVTGGAALIQKSNLYHIEGQWDLTQFVKWANVLVGADARIYAIIPDGNNFVDFSRPIAQRNLPLPDGSFGKDVIYKKFGGFVQGTKTFLDEKLKVWASLRADNNPYFTTKFTPRVSAVYTVAQKHNFRVTYQQGYRFPALFEALSYVNNGRVKRVGSLPFINDGLGYLGNSYTQTSVVNFNAAVSAAGNTDAAALANKGLLVKADLPEARPEQIKSFEIGYKSVLLNNRLVIDIDAYRNKYNGFLGQVQVYVPIGETVGTDASAIAMLDRNRDATNAVAANPTGNPPTAATAASKGQERYRVYTNAKNDYVNYGSALAITYSVYKSYVISANASFNKIKALTTSDIFVTGFNTPDWTTGLSFGNRAVAKNFGFNVTWKWQDSFLWESPLVTGGVNAFNTIDAQVTLRVPKAKATIKVGGTDLTNHRYIQYAGGPTLGAMYYVALTVDGLFN